MKRATLVLAAFALVLGGMGQVRADFYIFGDTNLNGESANYLYVTTSSGGSFLLSTATNEINPYTFNSGWWSTVEANRNNNFNFIAGSLTGEGDINDFFTFDITALAGQTVTSVALDIPYSGIAAMTGAGVTYYIYDVSTDPYTLNAKVNSPNIAIYNDLGSGTLYGSEFIFNINYSQYLITLDNAALSDLQAAIDAGDTYFSTGGTIYPSAVAAPEPSTLTLLGIGVVCSLCYGRRRRKQAVA